jgi:hypothetical protein
MYSFATGATSLPVPPARRVLQMKPRLSLHSLDSRGFTNQVSPHLQGTCVLSDLVLRKFADQYEQRQIHGDDDSSHDQAEDDNHQRLHGRQ